MGLVGSEMCIRDRGGVEVEGVSSDEARWDLATLSRFSAVLLDGVPADAVGEAGLATLAAWVEGGGGLMLSLIHI